VGPVDVVGVGWKYRKKKKQKKKAVGEETDPRVIHGLTPQRY
jgi:hypothetical protein